MGNAIEGTFGAARRTADTMTASDFSLLFALAGMSAAGCQADDTTAGDTDDAGTSSSSSGAGQTTEPPGTAETGVTTTSTTTSTSTSTSTSEPTATTPGGSEDTGEESGSGSSDTSSGTGGASFVGACEGFYVTYDGCFPREAGYGDCEYLLDYFEDGACLDSIADYFGCLSELDCGTLETYEGFPCREGFTAISDNCEVGFGFCQVAEGTFDFEEPPQFCTMTQHNCLDDHAYEVDCAIDANAGNVACTCQTDGVETAFTFEGDSAGCDSEPFYAALVAECGWPQEAADNLI